MYNLSTVVDRQFLLDEPDLVIVDSPNKLSQPIQKYVKNAPFSMGLDWFGSLSLDYNVVVFRHNKIPKAKIKVFEGFKYVIIERRIRDIKPPLSEKEFSNVLVVIGGGDIRNQSSQVVNILKDKGFQIQLVLGPNSSFDISQLRDIKNVCIKQNVENMATLIEASDWMVTNGGGCLFEAMCSARPVFALGQTIQEFNIIEEFKNKNLLAGYSIEDLYLINNDGQIKSNSVPTTVIDGNGGYRITKIVDDILSNDK